LQPDESKRVPHIRDSKMPRWAQSVADDNIKGIHKDKRDDNYDEHKGDESDEKQ
jgi:hypothetical protein